MLFRSMDFVPEITEQFRKQTQQEARTENFEFALNQHFRSLSLDWAKTHPGEVFKLSWIKIKRFWNPVPNVAEFRKPIMMVSLLLSFVPLIVFAMIGIIKLYKTSREDRVLVGRFLLPMVYFTLLHSVFVSSIRYRQPILPLLAVLAAIGIVAV